MASSNDDPFGKGLLSFSLGTKGGLVCAKFLEEEDVAMLRAFLITFVSVLGLNPFTQRSINPSMKKTTNLHSEMSVTNTDSL